MSDQKLDNNQIECLKDLFKNDIDRSINGVIKAEDTSSLAQELRDFVITKEIGKELEEFIEHYNEYDPSWGNGVWISGFFGSGKSHLLKMLSLVLENKEIDGQKPIDLFFEHNDDDLRPQFDLAQRKCPSESILFNIDSKSNTKASNAVLDVFMRVLNEHCGFCHEIPYIADFERSLMALGKYEEFKKAFYEESQKPWEVLRKQGLIINHYVAKALAVVNGNASEDNKNILSSAKDSFTLSVESFVNTVKTYIEQKRQELGSGYRLNFFVDELGQYIADETKLMLNLQTISEKLTEICKDGAWLFVTAQEDMDSIIGQEGKLQHGNDFSKIQDRFKIRLKLSSKNVNEVVSKRLLEKNDYAKVPLSEIYEQKHDSFKTLFDFTEDSRKYNKIRTEDDFINAYPFIPYQFDLCQECIKELSKANAFEGNFGSVGERSMLAVFHKVLQAIKDKPVGTIPSFDLMFEGVRSSIKTSTASSLLDAERNLAQYGKHELALRLLKTLLLVKHADQFKATVDNLVVLMQESIDDDRKKLRADISEALSYLLNQSYITQDGAVYHYLSDDEKDLESKINSQQVENSEINNFLADIFFNATVKSSNSKVHDNEYNDDYAFTKLIDGERLPSSRAETLAINLLSPSADSDENSEAELVREHLGEKFSIRAQLVVVLPYSDEFTRKLYQFKRTESYINHIGETSETEKRLIQNKFEQNHRLEQELRSEIKELANKASLYYLNNKQEISADSKHSKVEVGFLKVVNAVYRSRELIKNLNYDEKALPILLGQKPLGELSPAENEFNNALIRKPLADAGVGNIKTVDDLCNHFANEPYGWKETCVLALLCMLFSRGKIEFIVGGVKVFDASAIAKKLCNSKDRKSMQVQAISEASPQDLKNVRDFIRDYFNKTVEPDQASLVKQVVTLFNERTDKLNFLLNNASKDSWPIFADDRALIDEVINLAKRFKANDDLVFKELPNKSEKLLDNWDDRLEKLYSFSNNEGNKKIFADARSLVNKLGSDWAQLTGNENTNLGEKFLAIKNGLNNKDFFTGPCVRKLTADVKAFQELLSKQCSEIKSKLLNSLSEFESRVKNLDEFASLTEDGKVQIHNFFEKLTKNITNTDSYAMLSKYAERFDSGSVRDEVNCLLEELQAKVNASLNASSEGQAFASTTTSATPIEPTSNVVSATSGIAVNTKQPTTSAKATSSSSSVVPKTRKSVKLSELCNEVSSDFSALSLTSAKDVDSFLECLKDRMLKSIADGTKVSL